MKKFKKLLSLMLAGVMLFAVFSSCRKGPDVASDPGERVEPLNGGTLRLSCVSVDTMNPIITTHASVSDFLSLIYEGLFVVNSDMEVTPILASDYSVSNNNTVYTINLKENIRFHNGKFLTAHDVVSTFNYMSFYSTNWSSFMQYVAGYAADGNHSLVIKLNTPKTDFICNLDFPILPAGLMASDFLPQNSAFVPVGTGMYEYDRTVAHKNIILKANDDWHGGKDRAHIDEVDIEILSDENTIVTAFDAGASDMLTTSWRSISELELTSSMFNTFENEQNRFTFLGINCQSMYFDTAKERRALANSIDSEKLTADILLGHGTRATTPVRKGVYYNPETEELTADEWIDSDSLDKTPVECRLLYNSDSKTKSRVASSLKQQLESKGYSIYLDGQSENVYRDKVALGDYELYVGEVKLTQSLDMQFMFSSPLSGICNYDDSEFRALVTNLDLVNGAEDKKVAWRNFEKYYAKAVPQVPLYFTNSACFVNKRICGKLKPNLSVPFYGLDDMFIKSK